MAAAARKGGGNKAGRPPISLDKYVEPGMGGMDLSTHKAGQDGFEKVMRDFSISYPSLDRGSLELTDKVVVVGDSNVGKTCLVLRFCDDVYHEDYKSTIGVDFFWQKYTAKQFDFTLHIWDTAGQERFRSLSQAYYRGARACIVAFDLGVPDTLAHTKQWVAEVMKENQRNPDFTMFLVGCKSDMFHVVQKDQAEKVATEINAEYFEVSAKTGTNVKTLFDRVATVLFERALLRAAAQMKADADEKMGLHEEIPKALGSNGVGKPGVQGPPGSKVTPIGGGKGVGDTGAGKGTQNWKENKKGGPTRVNSGKTMNKGTTIQLGQGGKPAPRKSCCG